MCPRHISASGHLHLLFPLPEISFPRCSMVQSLASLGVSFFQNQLIHLFLAVLGFHCCIWAFSSCSEPSLLFLVVLGLLSVLASLVVEHRLQVQGLPQLQYAGSGSVAVTCRTQNVGSAVEMHRPSCFESCGIFLDLGSNSCPLDLQVDS